MDVLCLKDIEVWTHIGVPDAERVLPQLLLVTIELYGDLKKVSTSDDLAQGIDYQRVTNAVVQLGIIKRKTIEHVAEDIATMILQTFSPESVKVTVSKKPDLPLASASVTICRP